MPCSLAALSLALGLVYHKRACEWRVSGYVTKTDTRILVWLTYVVPANNGRMELFSVLDRAERNILNKKEVFLFLFREVRPRLTDLPTTQTALKITTYSSFCIIVAEFCFVFRFMIICWRSSNDRYRELLKMATSCLRHQSALARRNSKWDCGNRYVFLSRLECFNIIICGSVAILTGVTYHPMPPSNGHLKLRSHEQRIYRRQ